MNTRISKQTVNDTTLWVVYELPARSDSTDPWIALYDTPHKALAKQFAARLDSAHR